MRVLIAPMAAMAETSGPFSRSKALALALCEKGHEAAFCAAEDVNYKPVAGIKNYLSPIPSPMGLPMFLGKRLFIIAQKLGVQQKRKVGSFEEVLHIVGATAEKHFAKDVQCIRQAIVEFKPDVVYSEFRPAAIVAAKMERVRVVTGYSFPVQKSYGSKPECSRGVKRFLGENRLPEIESVLDIFHWAEIKLIPSCKELEPVKDGNAFFTGPFTGAPAVVSNPADNKNAIVAYMGNGTITPERTVEVLSETFKGSRYQVYIATQGMKPGSSENIHVAERFDFGELLPKAAAFINHGGQNSVMTGLLHCVPQIIYPGNVFERKYNAESIQAVKAGVYARTENFTAGYLGKTVKELTGEGVYTQNAGRIREVLLGLGGTGRAVQLLEQVAAGIHGEAPV